MSFSNMMQSGFGPGAVGILLAMLVLGGFGVLFIFAVEGEDDPSLATAAIICQQETDIHELEVVLEEKRKQLATIPKLKEAQDRLGKIKTDTTKTAAAVEENTAAIEQTTKECADLTESLVAYKLRYRERERAAAKGEKMESLTTLDGKTYKDVIIREVHPAGMRIGYDRGAGSTTIPSEKIPLKLQDRFQFDPAERAEYLRREREGTTQLVEQDQRNKEAIDNERKAREGIDATNLKAEARLAIPDLTRRIQALDTAHHALQLAMEREKLKTVRNTEVIRRDIEANRAERLQLEAKLKRAQQILNS